MATDKGVVAFGLLAQADYVLRRAEKLFDPDSEQYLSIGDALTAVSNAMGINKPTCDTASMTEVQIGCAVCLNMDNTHKTPATAVVKGYSVCENHVALVSNPDFNIFHLHGKARP